MEATDSKRDKRIVEQLNFGAKTSHRVTWEAWEFTVVGPHLLEVVNASYGFEKDDHAYRVGVEERDGVPVPAECACPADKYNEEYDCKHKVALATVGGPTVLDAAVKFSPPTSDESSSKTLPTMADKLKPDGGIFVDDPSPEEPEVEDDDDTCENGNPGCDGLDGEKFPCFACYEGSAASTEGDR